MQISLQKSKQFGWKCRIYGLQVFDYRLQTQN